MVWKTAILTASDKGSRGEREDTSAQVIRELVEEELGGEIVEYRIVPDEQDEIIASLIELTDYFQADLVLTTGERNWPSATSPRKRQDGSLNAKCRAWRKRCGQRSCRRTGRPCCSEASWAFAAGR